MGLITIVAKRFGRGSDGDDVVNFVRQTKGLKTSADRKMEGGEGRILREGRLESFAVVLTSLKVYGTVRDISNKTVYPLCTTDIV